MSSATIDEVAERAGVSVATVSRALRGLPNVAPATRDRVQRVAAELHYRGNANASGLASGRSRLIAVAMPVQHSWYFAQIISGIEAASRDVNYDVLLYTVDGEAARSRFANDDAPFRNRADGIVLVDLALPDDELDAMSETGVAVVTVGFETDRFDAVSIDNERATQELIEHLLRLGHERIGVVSGGETELNFSVPGSRLDGYRAALARFGRPFEPELLRRGDFSLEGAATAAKELLDLEDPPTAIFAMSDEMAYAVIHVAEARGLRVPEDVSVVGFDGHELSRMFSLTTVHQPVEEIGSAAARQLIRRIEGAAGEPTAARIDTTLRIRGSAASPR